MIQLHPLPRQAPTWQHALREAYSRPQELLRFLELDPALPGLQLDRCKDFPLRVPRGFAARMRKRDPADPLFLQVWPRAEEGLELPGYALDAVGDLSHRKNGGLLHKYHGRVLLIATGACGIHCRYCFRRHFPYADSLATRNHWQQALDEIRADSSIHEVILSGGDPLSLADDKLAELAQALEGIPHVTRLRLHTRQPIVLPERVDDRLLAWLMRGRLQKVFVLHANHPQEINAEVERACKALQGANVMLLNQSVLLRGINDSAPTLAALSERLSAAQVLPYYLHMLDRVQGSGHFEVPLAQARQIMRTLAASLPGYLVPRLAREVPGEAAKEILSW